MGVAQNFKISIVGFILVLAAATPAQVMPMPPDQARDPMTTAALTTASIMLSDMPESSATATAALSTSVPGTARLEPQDIEKILSQAEAASSSTVSYTGMRSTTATKRACRHHIFVVDRHGEILGRRSMPDAWTGSVDVALGKARTAAFFSSDENALSTRQLGQLSQAHGPSGTGGAGPLWGIGDTNRPGSDGDNNILKNSIVTFPGGLPLYKDGHLVGGIGVSGDAVDQDESVAFGGAQGYLPGSDVGTPTPLSPKPVDWFPAR